MQEKDIIKINNLDIIRFQILCGQYKIDDNNFSSDYLKNIYAQSILDSTITSNNQLIQAETFKNNNTKTVCYKKEKIVIIKIVDIDICGRFPTLDKILKKKNIRFNLWNIMSDYKLLQNFQKDLTLELQEYF